MARMDNERPNYLNINNIELLSLLLLTGLPESLENHILLRLACRRDRLRQEPAQFLNRPNMIADIGFHRGSHAQSLVPRFPDCRFLLAAGDSLPQSRA